MISSASGAAQQYFPDAGLSSANVSSTEQKKAHIYYCRLQTKFFIPDTRFLCLVIQEGLVIPLFSMEVFNLKYSMFSPTVKVKRKKTKRTKVVSFKQVFLTANFVNSLIIFQPIYQVHTFFSCVVGIREC